MKNKIIPLNPSIKPNKNTKVHYSTLLEQFISPFESEFADEYYEDIVQFAIMAWNLANMMVLIPLQDSEEAIETVQDPIIDRELMKKMIDYKAIHFKKYTDFFAEFELQYTDTEGAPDLTVVTQEQDDFLHEMMNEMEEYDAEFQANFINRCAIVITPLEPFLNWSSSLFEDALDREILQETRVYLVSEDIQDLEAWIRKKYSKIFEFELSSWVTNKKKWPQRRSFKMFKEWFRYDVTTTIFDFEKSPVIKGI